MEELTTERSFDSQDTQYIGVLDLFFDMVSMGICTIRHWQTSGRLVEELNVYAVTASYVGHSCACPIFGHGNDGCLYSQASVDVRSTGARIKCLYCRVVALLYVDFLPFSHRNAQFSPASLIYCSNERFNC